jgi:uncharacterized protein (TIRG00374 family)
VTHNRTKHFLVIFSVLFALGMLAVLFATVDKRQLVNLAEAFHPSQLLLAFVLFLLSIFLRGARFRYMSDGSGSYFNWWRIAALHQFFFTVVPFRLGELSFFPLASQLSHGDFSSSLPVLLSSRIYDFLLLALFAMVGVLGLKIPGYPLFFLLISAVIFLLAVNTRMIFEVSTWIFEKLHALLKLDAFSNFAKRLEDSGTWYRANEKSRFVVLGLTLIAWLVATTGFYFVFRAFSIELSTYAVLFLFAGMTLAGILGFFSIGSIGVSELGLTGLLIVLGFQGQHALALAIVTRLTMLAMTLLATGFIEGITRLRK